MRILPSSLFLRLWYAQWDFFPIRRHDEGTFFLCGGEAGEDVPESNGVGANAEGGTPFFGDDFGEASYAGFGETVVGLAAIVPLALAIQML